jgi:hypothetical protein
MVLRNHTSGNEFFPVYRKPTGGVGSSAASGAGLVRWPPTWRRGALRRSAAWDLTHPRVEVLLGAMGGLDLRRRLGERVSGVGQTEEGGRR